MQRFRKSERSDLQRFFHSSSFRIVPRNQEKGFSCLIISNLKFRELVFLKIRTLNTSWGKGAVHFLQILSGRCELSLSSFRIWGGGWGRVGRGGKQVSWAQLRGNTSVSALPCFLGNRAISTLMLETWSDCRPLFTAQVQAAASGSQRVTNNPSEVLSGELLLQTEREHFPEDTSH